jgi:periplasmic protein TonB
MNNKKTPKADLEGIKSIFTQVGLVVALAFVFLAFEWKKYDNSDNDWDQMQVIDIPEELTQITEQEKPKPKPKPKPQTTDLEIVEDDQEDDDIKINIEDDMDDQVMDFVPVDDVVQAPVEAEIFTVVEEAPSFPGGDEKLYDFLRENMVYPQMARESGIQGIVYVTFVVEPNGTITNVRVLRDIGGGCGDESIRVVKAMPSWTPGKQRGKAVRVQFNLPVKFTLQG